jgi:hypothetical protein
MKQLSCVFPEGGRKRKNKGRCKKGKLLLIWETVSTTNNNKHTSRAEREEGR